MRLSFDCSFSLLWGTALIKLSASSVTGAGSQGRRAGTDADAAVGVSATALAIQIAQASRPRRGIAAAGGARRNG